MDLTSLVEDFATGTYVVTRRTARRPTVSSKGRIVAGTSSSFSIRASVQAATGRDLLRLPEGRRANETRVLFTVTELMTGEQGAAYEADLVQIDLNNWEIQHRELWTDPLSGGVAYRCIAQAAT